MGRNKSEIINPKSDIQRVVPPIFAVKWLPLVSAGSQNRRCGEATRGLGVRVTEKPPVLSTPTHVRIRLSDGHACCGQVSLLPGWALLFMPHGPRAARPTLQLLPAIKPRWVNLSAATLRDVACGSRRQNHPPYGSRLL